MTRLRLAWFTPLPPMASGISDYSAEILPLIAEVADVDAICPSPPGLFSRLQPPPGIRVRHPTEYEPAQYDATYFHLGNNPWHEFVYESYLRAPGIAAFHEVVMHHLIAHVMVEAGHQEDRYRDLLLEEYDDRGANVYKLKRYGVATDFEKFLFPIAGHLARRARGVVVHSEDSRQRLRTLAPHAPIAVIPHHAGAPPTDVVDVTREEARSRLRLPADAFLVGHFGFITRPKQPEAVVGGFAQLHAEDPSAQLLLVGADHTGGGLDRLIARHGVGRSVRHVGFVDLTRFYLNLKAVDVVINLRYPSAGESSGTFARALAEGKPTIVNNYGSFAEVPREVTLKVEIDAPQGAQVGDHLLHVWRDREFAERLSRAARHYAATVLDPIRCRDLYVGFAEQVAAAPALR